MRFHRLRVCLLLLFVTGQAALGTENTLTITDRIGRDWANEPIVWELPGAKGDKVLVQRDGKAIPAQVVATTNGVQVLFVVDKLAKDGETKLTAELGHAGPGDTDLKVEQTGETVVLANSHAAVKLPEFAVRTASGKWTGGGRYATSTVKSRGVKTEILERGPVRAVARVTTTFDNQRTHVVTVSLWTGSRSIEIDERFDVGPDDKYQFKKYANDRDELGWEWWSWYGDKDGLEETHPNNWVVRLDSSEYQPRAISYFGSKSNDSEKGRTDDSGRSDYTLAHHQARRFEKYVAGHAQWRPDAVLWYSTSPTKDDNADAVAVYAHSVRHWRNPNLLPTPTGITLRTGVNDLRIVSRDSGQQVEIECPIGLGRRAWAIRVSTRKEMLDPLAGSPTALDAERVQRCMGLDITRQWITDWPMACDYPHLFIKPDEKNAYYARLKGKGIDSPGNPLDTFLRNQDQPGFDKDYETIRKQADQMVQGYCSQGMDHTTSYPGWMLGGWHGIIVASGLDNLGGHPLCKPEQARALRKQLAILTYCLTSRDAWPDKQINYGWGSMNMPVGRWGGLVVMASALSDHPMAKAWLKDAGRYFRMLLETEYAPDGVHISCPHYIGVTATSFYAWIALANSGLAEDASRSPALKQFARYYMQLMTPIDPRWKIRTLLTEGDGRPGSSPLPGILATMFKRTDPDLAGQLMQIWIDGGKDAGLAMGVPDSLIIDSTIAPARPKLGPQVFPGFGAVLRFRELGTSEEAYLAFLAGNFMIDHSNTDQLGFEWYEKGVPLTLFMGDMYQPMAATALNHNTLCWDVRAEGDPTPGKDKPGDWYHDHNLPWVEHARRPRLHLQIGFDPNQQKITETRGTVAFASDQPAAALVEGRVRVIALTEVPTRANYSIAMQQQIQTPLVFPRQPFVWTRRLLYVKSATAAGMNYLVVRDDPGGFAERTPSFNYWSLSDDVELTDHSAHFKGQLGEDTDVFVAVPERAKLFKDSFTHDQCEGIVGQRGFTNEKQVLARVEGQAGEGFLVTVFPHKADEPRPTVTPWQGGRGVKIVWKGETHFVLLDTTEHEINADGIQAKASCLVVKVVDAKNFTISLPAGGEARHAGHKLQAREPVELQVVNGQAKKISGNDLLKK